MKKNRGCLVKFLSFIASVFTALLITFCCHSCMTVYAADNVLLSLQETYALYGHDFMVSYYNPNRDYTVNIQAEFIGTTLETVPSSHWDNIFFTGSGNITAQKYAQLQKMPGLVYAIYNLDGQFFPYNDNYHFNIVKQFPITISNITRFQQNVFWSGYYDNGSLAPRNFSNVLYNTSFDGAYQILADGLANSVQSARRYYGYCIMPTYKVQDTTQPLDESRLAYMYSCSADFQAPTAGNTFSISGQTLRLNAVGALDVFNRHDITNPSSDEVWNWPALADAYADVVLLVITCPILTGYEPPPTTTAPNVPGTQQPATATAVTVDLSGLESGVAEIVRQQREELNLLEPIYYNGIAQVNQLNTIIQQLDAIYNRMLQNGDVPVQLQEAAKLQTLSPDLVAQVGTALRGTWPTMPANAFGEAPQVYAEFFNLFREPPFNILFSLGVFGLALSVAGWFLFKGRN